MGVCDTWSRWHICNKPDQNGSFQISPQYLSCMCFCCTLPYYPTRTDHLTQALNIEVTHDFTALLIQSGQVTLHKPLALQLYVISQCLWCKKTCSGWVMWGSIAKAHTTKILRTCPGWPILVRLGVLWNHVWLQYLELVWGDLFWLDDVEECSKSMCN